MKECGLIAVRIYVDDGQIFDSGHRTQSSRFPVDWIALLAHIMFTYTHIDYLYRITFRWYTYASCIERQNDSTRQTA